MMNTTKRQNYLSWDETFMLMSRLIAKRSKDPNTQTGACIVDKDNVIVGLGYNGFPRGCSDDSLSWGRDGDFLDKKYAYVVHAEANALYNANKSIKGCKLYCTLFPCNECAKTIIQMGITEIIYESDKYHNEKEWIASRKLFDLAGINCREYKPMYNMELTPVITNEHARPELTTESFDISQTKGFGQQAPIPHDPEEDKMIFEDIFNN